MFVNGVLMTASVDSANAMVLQPQELAALANEAVERPQVWALTCITLNERTVCTLASCLNSSWARACFLLGKSCLCTS